MINPKKRKKKLVTLFEPNLRNGTKKTGLIWEHVFIAIIGGELTQYPANTQVYSAPAT